MQCCIYYAVYVCLPKALFISVGVLHKKGQNARKKANHWAHYSFYLYGICLFFLFMFISL